MLEVSGLGILTVFAAGIVSFLSPCVLPLVPGYLSYVTGRSLVDRAADPNALMRLEALGISLCFVLGFTTVFLILGASATALGKLLLSYRYEVNIVGGVIVIVFGLFMTGLLKLTWLQREFRLGANIPGGHPIAAYVLGLAFAFGWTPCIGPILGAILTMSASSATGSNGVALLAIYSLGLGVPFLAVAGFADVFLGRLPAIRRAGRVLHLIAGGIMILMGVAMITGDLSRLGFWLLETFPAFALLG